MSGITPDAGAMSDLAQLITVRKRELGVSFDRLVERGDRVFTKGRWQQLATGVRLVKFPEPATLLSIAKALEVDVTRVVMATARTVGLPISETASAFATLLPPSVDDIDPDMQDAILRVIRLASRRTDDTSQEPGTQTGGTPQQSEAAIAADRRARAAAVEEAIGVNPITDAPVPRSKRRSVSESDGRTTGNKRAGGGGRR